MKVYVLHAEAGEYEDHTEWIVAVFSDPEKAKQYAQSIAEYPISWEHHVRSEDTVVKGGDETIIPHREDWMGYYKTGYENDLTYYNVETYELDRVADG